MANYEYVIYLSQLYLKDFPTFPHVYPFSSDLLFKIVVYACFLYYNVLITNITQSPVTCTMFSFASACPPNITSSSEYNIRYNSLQCASSYAISNDLCGSSSLHLIRSLFPYLAYPFVLFVSTESQLNRDEKLLIPRSGMHVLCATKAKH